MKNIFRSGFFKVIAIFLVVGVLCTIFGIIELADSKKTPIDLATISDDQIEKGAIVEGDIYYNFGVFETVENKRNGVTESTYYRYVIPVGEKSYMGIQVTDKSMIATMDTQTNETYDMMDGKIEDTTTSVHVKGKIVGMDKEDAGYFKDFMSSGGFTDDEISQYGKEYYIQIRNFDQAKPLLAVGIIALIIDAVLIILTVLKGKKAAPQTPQNFGGEGFGQITGGPGMDQQAGMGQPQAPQTPQDFNQYFAQQPGDDQTPQGPTNF
jgi:hypothetical protein